MWFTVQEGEVIDGNVPSEIIPDCTFNQNLPKRNKSTTLQFQIKIFASPPER